MRTAAEVGEIALGVGGDGAVLKVEVDVLALVLLAVGLELGQCLGLGHLAAHHRLVFLGQLAHLGLDGGEVFLRDDVALLGHHVVEETVLHSGSEAELYAGIKFFERLGQQVGGGMPEGMLTLLVVELVKCDGSIAVDWAVELHRLAIHSTRHDVACESRRYALGDLITSYALCILTHRAVWECDFNHDN